MLKRIVLVLCLWLVVCSCSGQVSTSQQLTEEDWLTILAIQQQQQQQMYYFQQQQYYQNR